MTVHQRIRMTTPRRHPGSPRTRAAFTLVELLVAIAIIALLLGIVIAGMFGAISFARRAAGTAQLQAVAQGLEAFNTDMTFYPPLISQFESDHGPIETPETLAAQESKANRNATLAQSYREARYMSEWSLAAYLLGEGDLNGDGNRVEDELDQDDGKAGLGIRNPGESRAWKAPDGSHKPQTTGNTYGPYVDPGFVEKFLRRVPVEFDSSSKRIVREDGGTQQYMYQLVDAFDVPVRYYRGWITRDQNDAPTLDLLPIELRSAEGVESQMDTGKWTIEPERSLMTAPYALLSAGERADAYIDANGDPVNPFGDFVPHISGTGIVDLRPQADGDGVFLDQAGSPFDPGSIDKDAQRVLLKMLKSNIRYLP
jgi:prepilin-type N-terminal cleavage/methylation domain-containing protein